jgi:hypothetical protein
MFKIKMRLKNETKGTYRYEEVEGETVLKGDEAVIGSLYIRKAAFNHGAAPKELSISID